MRSWWWIPACVVAAASGACSSGEGMLDMRVGSARVMDDGTPTEISIRATTASGGVGSGLVTLSSSAGLVGDSSVRLDDYGKATTTFACDVNTDSRCVGSATVTATWNGVTFELPIRLNERCPGGKLCGSVCVAIVSDWFNCGGCGVQCAVDQACIDGRCAPCPGGDCDSDGWLTSTGDCCDQYNVCTRPSAVNPGAVEALDNGVDDNCNGLLDTADTLDTQPCDSSLGPRAGDPLDFARALGLCRTTTESERTWGVLSAEILLANGDAGVPPESTAIRPGFGTLAPQEGARLVVLATEVAADSVQTNPKLGDPVANTAVDIDNCHAPACIDDWFRASRLPIKAPGKLPDTPACGMSGSSSSTANDSVMLRLRVRAPTNAVSFRLKTRFFSDEYPEFVCSRFNDQMVLLIDTPGASVRNPTDKNLMTYSLDGGAWPVGINLAAGTPLFQSCVPRADSPMCWNESVNDNSCKQGPSALAQTQFGQVVSTGGQCLSGGATAWMGTRGNVKPGGIFELRAVIWNVNDHDFDSLVLLDDFEWSVVEVEPGTDVE
ncbi:MAG: choice-of-anchor L domain-containing protein [Myxococcota bacterium]